MSLAGPDNRWQSAPTFTLAALAGRTLRLRSGQAAYFTYTSLLLAGALIDCSAFHNKIDVFESSHVS